MCSLFWKVIRKVRLRQNAYTSQESLYLKAICAFMQALSKLCTTTTRNFQKLPSYTFHVFLFTFFFAAAHFHLRWPLAFPISWMHRLPNFLIHGAPLSALCVRESSTIKYTSDIDPYWQYNITVFLPRFH